MSFYSNQQVFLFKLSENFLFLDRGHDSQYCLQLFSFLISILIGGVQTYDLRDWNKRRGEILEKRKCCRNRSCPICNKERQEKLQLAQQKLHWYEWGSLVPHEQEKDIKKQGVPISQRYFDVPPKKELLSPSQPKGRRQRKELTQEIEDITIEALPPPQAPQALPEPDPSFQLMEELLRRIEALEEQIRQLSTQ